MLLLLLLRLSDRVGKLESAPDGSVAGGQHVLLLLLLLLLLVMVEIIGRDVGVAGRRWLQRLVLRSLVRVTQVTVIVLLLLLLLVVVLLRVLLRVLLVGGRGRR